MAGFTPSKKTANDFNNGVAYTVADVVQASTVNNLVESALYAQDAVEEGVQQATDIANEGVANATAIANSAKQTAESALSQVNQVLADKTLLPDVQKNYYNLGAFDTYVSNGDGTATISRKTGYLIVNGSETWVGIRGGSNTSLFGVSNIAPDIGNFPNSQVHIKATIKSVSADSIYNNDTQAIAVDSTGRLEIRIQGMLTATDLKAYLNTNPVYVQYELNSAYTETVIENQPIHTLNQEQELKLRNEIVGKNGVIVHGNTSFYFSTVNNSPASTIGGDWVSLGSISAGNTIYGWRKA